MTGASMNTSLTRAIRRLSPVVLLMAVACRDRVVSLADVVANADQLEQSDTVITTRGVILDLGYHMPFTGYAVRRLVDGRDTVMIAVLDTTAVGRWVTLRVTVHNPPVFSRPFLVAATGSVSSSQHKRIP